MQPYEDPLAKLTKEEFDAFMKKMEALDCNKFRNVLPELLVVNFRQEMTVFERPFGIEDFTTLHAVLGPPSVTSQEARTKYRYTEVFKNFQMEFY